MVCVERGEAPSVVRLKLTSTMAAHPTLRIVGQLSTVSTGGSRESAIAMSPAALPLGPLLARYRISNDRVYYTGSLPIAQVAATARSAESDRTRRARAFQKYQANYARMVDPVNKAKRVAVRKAMSDPRRGYAGCIATKVKPRDIKHCVDNYDRPEYSGIELHQLGHQGTKTPRNEHTRGANTLRAYVTQT